MDTLILPAMILKITSFHAFPLKSAWAQAALMGKSWKETIFKIMVGSINVSICNLLLPIVFCCVAQVLYCLDVYLRNCVAVSWKIQLKYIGIYEKNKCKNLCLLIKEILGGYLLLLGQ